MGSMVIIYMYIYTIYIYRIFIVCLCICVYRIVCYIKLYTIWIQGMVGSCPLMEAFKTELEMSAWNDQVCIHILFGCYHTF